MLLGYVHVSCHILVGLLIIFKRGLGFRGLSNCVSLTNTLKQMHVYELIYQKLVHTMSWETQGEKL